MKTFRFKLDSALRWRESQVDLQRNRTALAAAELKSIGSAIELRRTQLSGAAAELAHGSSGEALQSVGGWMARCRREIREFERQAQAAELALASKLRDLVQANQNMRVLEKLRQSASSEWREDAGREMEGFAAEMFLRQVTISRRTGA